MEQSTAEVGEISALSFRNTSAQITSRSETYRLVSSTTIAAPFRRFDGVPARRGGGALETPSDSNIVGDGANMPLVINAETTVGLLLASLNRWIQYRSSAACMNRVAKRSPSVQECSAARYAAASVDSVHDVRRSAHRGRCLALLANRLLTNVAVPGGYSTGQRKGESRRIIKRIRTPARRST
jgi:hypothetical protein